MPRAKRLANPIKASPTEEPALGDTAKTGKSAFHTALERMGTGKFCRLSALLA